MCGHEIEKLKKPLIESMIPFTRSRAAFIGDSMALLMPFHMLVTVPLIALNTLEIVLDIPLIIPEIVPEMPDQIEDATL